VLQGFFCANVHSWPIRVLVLLGISHICADNANSDSLNADIINKVTEQQAYLATSVSKCTKSRICKNMLKLTQSDTATYPRCSLGRYFVWTERNYRNGTVLCLCFVSCVCPVPVSTQRIRCVMNCQTLTS
jgi:hypothetical protein